MTILLAVLLLLSPAVPRTRAADPRVAGASYWGGTGDETMLVAAAPDGSVYLAGTTTSPDLRVRRGRTIGERARSDVWIAKLSASGRLRWSTYLGGRGVDGVGDVTTDPTGNVVVVGSTNSPDFPLAGEVAGAKDGFVTKLSPSGEIVFSTLHGGYEGDHATAVAVDAVGALYVHGYTFSEDFPTTPGALKERTTAESQDATLVKLTPAGEVVYSTRLGGEQGNELGSDVIVDAGGSAYVSGWTDAPDFPTVDAAQGSYAGAYDGYLAKVDPAGAGFEFATFLGGDDLEGGGFLAETDDGIAVALTTYSRRLPATGFQPRAGGGRNDAYLAVLSSAGELEASTYLGGSGTENPTSLAAGSDGLYVVGSTGSKDFPLERAFQRRFAGRSADDQYLAEAFVTKVADDLSAVAYSSFLGGSRDDGGAGVAARAGGAWVAGTTYSRDFPTRRPADRTWNGGSDGWVARIVD